MVRSVAIIGANGFLGKYLVAAFRHAGHEVVAVYNQSYSSEAMQGVTWKSWSEFLVEEIKFDAIIYSASVIPYGAMQEQNDEMMRVNALQILEIKKRFSASHFIYISSVSIFAHGFQPINERSAWLPQNVYAETKMMGELLSRGFAQHAILRCSSIYGIGMKPHTFIPRCIAQAHQEKAIVIYGDGSRRQNYIHAFDVANMCIALVHDQICGEYLAVAPASIENLTIAQTVADCLKADIHYTGEDHSPSFEYDAHDTYQTLNYIPQKDCLLTIKEMCHAE